MKPSSTPDPTSPTTLLSPLTKLSYGVGHVFNDLCASMWFTYLLVFFQGVLEFDSTKAGVVLLVGQLADGLSTPVVGIFSDRENKIPVCARYGRRKIWHLIGTFFVLVSFPFIFSSCLGCSHADQSLQIVYYCFFVVLFQFGWASVQISHLSLIPEITKKKHTRTELNSIRYAFTVLSNLSVYSIAFLLLTFGLETTSLLPCSDGIYNGTTTTTFSPCTDSPSDTTVETPQSEDNSISPEDASAFRNMALFCICTGVFFSAIFHFGVKEPEYKDPRKVMVSESSEKGTNLPASEPSQHMAIIDWFKEVAFYQIALLYMATRLFVNLYQVYIPMYVQYTLKLNKTAIATVPFAMYLAGFAGSLVMKQVNKMIGRKGTFSLGCAIGLVGCTAIAFDKSDAYLTWGVYCVAAVLGVGGSTVLITSLSITADLIGNNVEGGAFVYGFMSFTDKIANGIVIMIIQNAAPTEITANSDPFYQRVITYACGSCCILGIAVACSLIPVKVGQRKGLSKKVAALIEEESRQCTNIVRCPRPLNQADCPSTISRQNMLERERDLTLSSEAHSQRKNTY